MAKKNRETKFDLLNQLDSLLEKFEATDLRAVNGVVRNWNRKIQDEAAGQFKLGEKVWFDARTRGIVHGVIESFGRKRFGVRSTSGVRWRVSPSLLRKEEKK